MRIEIAAHGFTMSDALHDTVLQEIARLAQGLRRPIGLIEVDLYDEHAAVRRGCDKRCCVRIQFEDTTSVERDDAESDFQSSVAEAFARVLSMPRPLVTSSLAKQVVSAGVTDHSGDMGNTVAPNESSAPSTRKVS
jgi:hypothetical protein